MERISDSLVKLNAVLFTFLLLIVSSVIYVIFKYHIVGFGTFSDFIIAIANVIMASVACYGIYSAKGWLKKREEEEVFNKTQKINSHIVKFTSYSKNLLEVVSSTDENKENMFAKNINSSRENIVSLIDEYRKKIEMEWMELTFELESMRLISNEYTNNSLHIYFHAVKDDAKKMISAYIQFLMLFASPWAETKVHLKKEKISNIAESVSSSYAIIKDAYDNYEESLA
ncbi:hypothetical protein [Serratia fonticola]|uniref:hypothetical protein n=1 Tax=Serratia fonticola TaxID=47917 RepID=UPI0034C6100A